MKLSITHCKITCFFAGLFIGATALAVGNLPTVKVVYMAEPSKVPAVLNVIPSGVVLPYCIPPYATPSAPLKQGDTFSVDLNNIDPRCDTSKIQAIKVTIATENHIQLFCDPIVLTSSGNMVIHVTGAWYDKNGGEGMACVLASN